MAHPAELQDRRPVALVAIEPERRALAGDQLYVDLTMGRSLLDLSAESPSPRKFGTYFGRDAMRFVNSPVGRALNLRGVNANVVVAGTVKTGDTVRKI